MNNFIVQFDKGLTETLRTNKRNDSNALEYQRKHFFCIHSMVRTENLLSFHSMQIKYERKILFIFFMFWQRRDAYFRKILFWCGIDEFLENLKKKKKWKENRTK